MAQAKPTQQDTATTASEATPLLGSDVEGATLELSFAGEVANLLRTAVPVSEQRVFFSLCLTVTHSQLLTRMLPFTS